MDSATVTNGTSATYNPSAAWRGSIQGGDEPALSTRAQLDVEVGCSARPELPPTGTLHSHLLP